MSTAWNQWQQSAEDEDAEAERDYEDWTKDEIQDELERRGLPKTGNKPELIEALRADDGDS